MYISKEILMKMENHKLIYMYENSENLDPDEYQNLKRELFRRGLMNDVPLKNVRIKAFISDMERLDNIKKALEEAGEIREKCYPKEYYSYIFHLGLELAEKKIG